MVSEESISVANAKLVMMKIVDGDKRMPSVIAEEQGFIGGPMTTNEVRDACEVTLSDEKNAKVITKVLAGNTRPLMSLVGQVMKALNRRGDPVVIKKLLEEGIAKRSGNKRRSARIEVLQTGNDEQWLPPDSIREKKESGNTGDIRHQMGISEKEYD